MLDFIFQCIFGTQSNRSLSLANHRSSESVASEIVTKILEADTRSSLQKELNEVIRINGWSDTVAKAILDGLQNAIKNGTEMARAATEVLAQSKKAAASFAIDHPVYATLIALGVLALLTSWALEILGFGELGPIEGSFAAAWQRTYAGYVPKRDLFGYFQRLGMKWNWRL
ncbi:uncharacterized protein N7473_011067 [Penicillium subrubescens]|uniref:Lincomycin-condensing protein lmbA n=1 Tax=Penicillium subrubescens TaxID=1316194 RepID=A0A1Q5ULA3_9EURO|nr:uncharacterized protein N7473_011067 [Penicillium subrubescens]KAJ5882805.1 hypothetical protein N7473_011067 [Penicillium subrubescens]OKP13233.1 hypothetical protein PENSUB_1081 [Penicillium subrubescens]